METPWALVLILSSMTERVGRRALQTKKSCSSIDAEALSAPTTSSSCTRKAMAETWRSVSSTIQRADSQHHGAWEWNIEHHQRAGRSLPQWGTSETLEGAMAALKACWESADVPIKWPPAIRPKTRTSESNSGLPDRRRHKSRHLSTTRQRCHRRPAATATSYNQLGAPPRQEPPCTLAFRRHHSHPH